MNNDVLPNWSREHYRQAGGEPFLFYVIFGAAVEELALSRSKYRCDEIPAGLEMLSYGPGSHPEVLDSFRSGYLWTQLQENEPQLAQEIATRQQCVIVRGSLGDQATLNYLRNTIGLLTCLLDHGGVGIFDPLSFQWWSPSAWRSKVFDPAALSPNEHVVILVSEETDGTHWFHTRGLRKFGRPDLSIHGAPASYQEAVVDMFNRFIEFQAFGGVIENGEEVRLSSLPPGMRCVWGGSEEDPDFNNVHVEVHWPASAEQGAPTDARTSVELERWASHE